ncbi:hypothetical protein [Aeromonas sp. 30P]|jgi:hypothetical protein|uniref:hypothetical protein n=1 Tax=Aeromonas sp. 30P TaxID=3452717 RepID=UPI003F373A6F
MNGTLSAPQQESTQQDLRSGSLTNNEIAGKIADHIGTGRNAKDSFIWMTITWSFIIASGLSILIFIRSFCVISSGEILLDSITKLWSVFVPIITLALGYAFGKGDKAG